MPPGRGRTRKNHESPRPSHSRAVAAFLALIALSSSVGCGRIGFGFERLPARSTDSGETDASVDARMGTSDGAPTDASDAGASGDASPVDGGDGFDGSTPSDATPDGSIPTCTSGEVGECSTACGDGTRVCEDGIWGACTAPSEICNGVDDDCDSNIDDGFTCASGSTGSCTTSCGSTGSRTCNASCGWGACTAPTEVCNGVDDDCDSAIDDGFTCASGSSGSCTTSCGSTGSRTCNASCGWGACTAPTEVCNGVDDDCDSTIDDGFTCASGSSGSCTTSCGSTGSRTCNASCGWGTCTAPTEVCNGVDDDCDSTIDDGFTCASGSSGSCTTSCGSTGSRTCNASCGWGACTAPTEVCNGVDDDCDTNIDEGLLCTPTYRWTRTPTGTGGATSQVRALAIDAAGNVYVTGDFTSTINFGGSALVSAGMSDIFVASFDANGAHRWSFRYGSTGEDVGRDLVLDPTGNVVVTGYFAGTVNFGGGARASAGAQDIFVATFSSAGAHVRSARFGGSGEDRGLAVGVDTSGNVIVTGYFNGTVDFGGGARVSAGAEDVFIASYGPTGAHRWSLRFGGTSNDYGYGAVPDSSGNIFATGYFGSTVNFGGGALTSAGSYDIYVASYSSAGAHRWSQRFGGTGSDRGRGAAVDASGNVVVTGSMAGTVNFGGGALTSAGGDDIYVASFGSTGTHRWSRRFGSTSSDWGEGVAFDASGNTIMTGYFGGTINAGGSSLVSAGGEEIVLASFDASGAHRWSMRFGGTGNDQGIAVAASPVGNVTLTGFFAGTVNFGGGPVMALGSPTGFILRLQ